MPPPEPPLPRPFLGARRLAGEAAANHAAFAFIGLPTGSPYRPADVRAPAAGGAQHLRAVCVEQEMAEEVGHYDFDLEGPLMPSGRPPSLLDYGDLVTDPLDLEDGRRAATRAVRCALGRGSLPLVIGGDHSITQLAVAAYAGCGTINLLHIDAHLDFRDQVDGVRDGYSSPVRRIREMGFVDRIVQVGLRGVGSARAADVRDARAAGNTIIRAADLHLHGPAWCVEQMTWNHPWYVTVDVDGLDPSVAPATGYPVPGGLTVAQAAELIRAIAARGLLAGLDITELRPELDVRGLTAIAALRLITLAMGFAARGAEREDMVLPSALAPSGIARPPAAVAG